MVIDARDQAAEQVRHRFDVRVLEPAPPADPDAPWCAPDELVVDRRRLYVEAWDLLR
jgi:hypothetical protein